MAIAMEEDYLGRSGDKLKRQLRFIVTGTDDDAAVRAHAEANVPSTHDGLVARNISNIKPISDMRWSVTANYGGLSLYDIPEPASGTATYTFSAYVEPETIYFSDNRVGKFPSNAPEVQNGLVGLQFSEGEHQGIQIPAGPVTDRLTYEYPSATIPSTYRNTVRSLIGKVNNATFLDQPAGSMRFVACTASVTSSGKQTIDFSFAYRENKSITVGTQSLGTVPGWDFPWSINDVVVITDPAYGGEVPVPRPRYIYVERPSQVARAAFSGLGLPSV